MAKPYDHLGDRGVQNESSSAATNVWERPEPPLPQCKISRG